VPLAPKPVLSGQTYVSGSAITFDGIQLTISDGTAPPTAGDLFHVVSQSRYAGDSTIQDIEVADGEVISTSIPGHEVFSGPNVNVFEAVQHLLAALRGNFRSGVEESLGDLDHALSQVSAAQAEVGALANRLEATSSALEDAKVLATNTLSSFADIDLARTISDLTLQEYAIQAAGETLGRIFENSLLKHLR